LSIKLHKSAIERYCKTLDTTLLVPNCYACAPLCSPVTPRYHNPGLWAGHQRVSRIDNTRTGDWTNLLVDGICRRLHSSALWPFTLK